MKKPSAPLSHQRIPAKVIILFTRQLATLLNGGTSLVNSLHTLSLQEECPAMGHVVEHVTRYLEAGHRLSDAFNRFPQIFPKLYVTMVQIGEKTGKLNATLEKLADWMERDHELVQKIRSSLTYPAFVMVLATGLTLFMFYTILPSFVEIFEEMHLPLPAVTRVVVAITRAVQSPLVWLAALATLAAGASVLRRALADQGQRALLFRLVLRVPLLGGMLYYGTTSRFCSSAGAMITAGMPIQLAFRMAASASGSPLLQQDAAALTEAIIQGDSPATYMSFREGVYSPTMVHMMVAGEESAKLGEMLEKSSEFHYSEMQTRMEALSAALEPILLVAVALVVGTIILSVFLPLYGFINHI